jgi:hypothetical protein
LVILHVSEFGVVHSHCSVPLCERNFTIELTSACIVCIGLDKTCFSGV